MLLYPELQKHTWIYNPYLEIRPTKLTNHSARTTCMRYIKRSYDSANVSGSFASENQRLDETS